MQPAEQLLEPSGCSRHPGSRVVRNGTAATAAGRVQKYRCQPPGGTPGHSFTGPLPGGEPRPDGQPALRPPRRHRYDAAVIARALYALARGASYRQARIAALGPAGFTPAGAVAVPDAKLISRWLDSFGPVLQRELSQSRPPSVVMARAVLVRRPSPAASGQPGAWLLCLAGCEPGAPSRLWPAVLAPRPDTASWLGVLRQRGSRPGLLLCESPEQEAAAASLWGPPLLVSAGSRPGTGRRAAPVALRALLWPPPDEGDVTGHVLSPDVQEALRGAAAADAAVRHLAGRAASIRTRERADTLLGLMALQVSGLASTTTMARILARS